MSRFVYVNGRYLPHNQAMIAVEDRGFQFADSVYEVIEVHAGALIDETRHLKRLSRSLSELLIPPPMTEEALRHVLRETRRRNRVQDGFIYLQVTRGAGRRDFLIPGTEMRPTLVVIARSQAPDKLEAQAAEGIGVVTVPEMRWARCDIKTVMLLPAVLAKSTAREQGAKEAWFVDAEGHVTEGASSNAWIVTAANELITRAADERILAGVTRRTVRDVIEALGLTFVERAFSVAEAKTAKEAFITAATVIVMPVVRIDETPVASGRPGPITLKLRAAFHGQAETSGS